MSFPFNVDHRTGLTHPSAQQRQNAAPGPAAPAQPPRLDQPLPPVPPWASFDPALSGGSPFFGPASTAFDMATFGPPLPPSSAVDQAPTNPLQLPAPIINREPRVLVRILHAPTMPEPKRRRIEPPVAAPPVPFLPDDLSRADVFEDWLKKLADTNRGGLGLQNIMPFVPPEIMHAIADDEDPNFATKMALVSKGMYAAIDLAFPLRRTAGLRRDLKLALHGRRDVTAKLFERILKALVTPRNGYDQALLTPLGGRVRNLMLLMLLESVDTLRNYMRPPRISAICDHLSRLAPPDLAMTIQDYAIYRHGRRDANDSSGFDGLRSFNDEGLKAIVTLMPESECKKDAQRALLTLFENGNSFSLFDEFLESVSEDLRAELYLYAATVKVSEVFFYVDMMTFVDLNRTSKNLLRSNPKVRALAMHRACNILIEELPNRKPKHFALLHSRHRWPDLELSNASKAIAAILLSMEGLTDEDRHLLMPKLARVFGMLMGRNPTRWDLIRKNSSRQVSAHAIEHDWIMGSDATSPSSGTWIFKQLVNGMTSMPDGASKREVTSRLNAIASQALSDDVRVHLLKLLGDSSTC